MDDTETDDQNDCEAVIGVEAGDNLSDEFCEDPEPRLKYMRLLNNVTEILSKDIASCVAVHPRFICLGTEWGHVHLLDHQGNSIKNKQLRHHTVCVSAISIDLSGEFIASCSHDGKVYVYGLYSCNYDMVVNMETLLTSVQIDPNFKKSANHRRFVTGDNKLVLHEKVILPIISKIKATTLYDATMEGGVINMAWCTHFIAWATNIGIRVYDIQARVSLGLIKWQRNASVSPDQCKCSLVWAADQRSLLVGWMNTIYVCFVRKRSVTEFHTRDLPEYIVEQVTIIPTDCIVCGIGPLCTEELVVLGYYPPHLEIPGNDPDRPRILVYPMNQSSDRFDIDSDALSLRGYEKYTAKDYQLVCMLEETRFTIVSPKDIIVASPYDSDDRVEWMIDNNKFEEAMKTVILNEKLLTRNTLIDVGRKYLDHLLFSREFELAAEVCKQILGTNKALWEKEVYKFARVDELRKVSKYLPQGDDKIDSSIYEMVLYECLQLEPERFLELIKEWPPDLYKVPTIINAVLEHMIKSDLTDKDIILEALAILYSHNKTYDKALAMYLKLRHIGVFEMIRKHKLYNVVHDMIEQLMDLDVEQTIKMLTEKDKKISTKIVMSKLEHNSRYLYLYLDALYKSEGKSSENKDYHGKLVLLYAKYNREKLLPLLRQSDTYPIREALNMCKASGFYPELVYLLGREGNIKEALNLIMDQLKDIQHAITFCQEHDDPDLWQDLINHALNKPEYITFLLQRIGMFVDPRILVSRIQDGLEIPGLKYSLVKMMRDYNLQMSVQEGCKKILVSDYFNLQERLINLQTRGIAMDSSCVCGVCHQQLMSSQLGSSIITFNCKHSFHEQCVPTHNLDKCEICSTARTPNPNSNL